jgi:hypothetical protein
MMDDSINSGVVDNDTHTTTSIQLESMIVYPIKSCAGFSVQVWPLSDCGTLTKPKAFLFYKACLFHSPWLLCSIGICPRARDWNVVKSVEVYYWNMVIPMFFFPHLNTRTLWNMVCTASLLQSGWERVILEIPLCRRKWVNFLSHKLWTPHSK